MKCRNCGSLDTFTRVWHEVMVCDEVDLSVDEWAHIDIEFSARVQDSAETSGSREYELWCQDCERVETLSPEEVVRRLSRKPNQSLRAKNASQRKEQ